MMQIERGQIFRTLKTPREVGAAGGGGGGGLESKK